MSGNTLKKNSVITTATGDNHGFQQQEALQQQHRNSSLKLPDVGESGGVGLRNRRGSNTSSICGSVINTRKYIREVYGPFLCSLLLISAFLVIIGGVLMLAGFYVPPLIIDNLQQPEQQQPEQQQQQQQQQQHSVQNQRMKTKASFERAQNRNQALNGLRISGVTMLTIGIIGLTVLVLTPIVCLRRTEYALLPDSDDFRCPRSSFSSASGLPDDIFTFSVVKQHIQPKKKKKSGGGSGGSAPAGNIKRISRLLSKQRTQQHQQRYDKGFLSPELNRGPIFVSDGNFNVRDSSGNRIHRDGKTPDKSNGGRNRSSSFEIRLSPRHSSQQHHSRSPWHHPRHSLSGGKPNPDILLTRSGPVKAGSFHSLR